VIATVGQLEGFGDEMSLPLPHAQNDLERLLRVAEDQVCSLAIGARFSDEMLAALTPDQLEALQRAICVQAAWVFEDDEYTGPTDIAGLGEGITFVPRDRPRLSPAVDEILAYRDLIHRSGMARPTPAPVPAGDPCPDPWWWGP
jgi:hypothetical protein